MPPIIETLRHRLRLWRLEGPPAADAPRAPIARRLGWFAALASASAMLTALAAYGLKALLPTG